MNRRAVGVGVAAIAAGVVGWTVRTSNPWDNDDHELEAALEDSVASDAGVAWRALSHVRARIAAEGPSEGLDTMQGRRLWLCAYEIPGAPWCAVGNGDTLAAAIDQATDAVVARGRPSPSTVWKLDWEIGRSPGSWPRDARPHEAGTVGIDVAGAMILPSEVLERDLFATDDEEDPSTYDHPAIRRLLADRGATVGESFDFDRIRTASWVEPAPGAPPVRTYRVHEWALLDAEDPDAVLTRAVWAAESLARTVGPDGRIAYLWDVSEGREKKGSNLLRHAGSTYSLIQAWARTGHTPWKDAADRALGYLLSKSKTDERTGPYGGGTGRYLVEGSHIKLGGAGLALVALATWQATTGDTSRAAEAREFATYLVSQQEQSGEFVYFASKTPGGEPRDDTSAYYPGEAVLGLVLWSQLDPDFTPPGALSGTWLQTARRGADWLIDERDAGKTPSELENDHWLMIALDRLYVATRDARYRAHALRLAEAVAYQQRLQEGHDRYHRDYRGGYYEPPRATPASTRAEGLVAVLDLLAEDDDADPAIRSLLLDTVRHLTQSQYTPPMLYWMPRRDRVAGAVAGGIVHPDLRNDFTQHALSALLGTERVLRREAGVPLSVPIGLDGMLAPVVLDTPEPTL